MAWSWEFWKVIYPCIFLTTFFWLKQSYHPKNYVSLYYPCIHIEGKKNTRIHKISGNTFLEQFWKFMNPCIFLQNTLNGCKIQGYITLQITGPKFWFWNLTYPCNFLTHIYRARKLQGYIRFHQKLHILVISLPSIWV